MNRFICFSLIILLSSCVSGKKLTGKIIKVSDGDTVILLDKDNKQHKIRLDGIDCPERGQDFGTKATEFTRDLCAGKYVIVEYEKYDQYKRILGIVYVNGINVNEALLKEGLAWKYKYNKSTRYEELEDEARKQKRNIRSMKNPVAPWDFRKANKK